MIKYIVSSLFLTIVSAFGAAPHYMSPAQFAVSTDGKTLYTAAATGKAIVLIDAVNNTVTRTFPLPRNPKGISLSKDGTTLFVTAGVADGKLFVIDAASGKLRSQIAVGHSPLSPVPTDDGTVVYVANCFLNRVCKVDLALGNVVATVPVTREPIAMVLSPDGKSLFVANHLPAGSANGARIAARVAVIDTASFKRKKTIELANGTINLRNMRLSIDGKWIFIPSYIARFSVPTTQLARGWMNTAALSILDVDAESLYHAFLMDDVDLGAANPWDVVCTPDNKYICVTHSSTHEVSVINRKGLFDRLAKLKSASLSMSLGDYETATDSPVNRLDFMVDIRRRVSVKANGPKGIAFAAGKIFTANYFSDNISTFKIGPLPQVSIIPLTPKQVLTPERKGEIACSRRHNSVSLIIRS